MAVKEVKTTADWNDGGPAGKGTKQGEEEEEENGNNEEKRERE